MNPAYKKIYTCTPVAFHANDGFFIRDTGLIASTLRTMGVESKCIMPLPHYDDDQREHLIRTEYRNLFSEEWWKALGIDALVLYSWGAPRYCGIARAVRKAGIRLVIHMDSSGDFEGCFPVGTPWYARLKRRMLTRVHDVFRAWHMRQADTITMCPDAAAAVSRRLFYGKWVQDRCFPMPCPVSPDCKYSGVEKEDIILCVGRWDDKFQKRPEMLMATLENFYAGGATAETRIYGTITDELRAWHEDLPNEVAGRIKLLGYLQNSLLWQEYDRAKLILSTSRFESSHIVSAEALCCGCSVVTPPLHKGLRDVLWYTSRDSGTVAVEDSATALAEALRQELEHWAASRRNPRDIAEAWQPHFHADKVFNKIFE